MHGEDSLRLVSMERSSRIHYGIRDIDTRSGFPQTQSENRVSWVSATVMGDRDLCQGKGSATATRFRSMHMSSGLEVSMDPVQ